MSFIRYMFVLNLLATAEVGMTAGQIHKQLPNLSVAQIKLTVNELVGEGMVREEKVQYRPHIVATIYHFTKAGRDTCAYPVMYFDNRLKQRQMNTVDRLVKKSVGEVAR